DSLKIFPAQIFGPTTAKVGETLTLKCSFPNIQSTDTEVQVYLCKNGVGERLDLLAKNDEHIFNLRDVSLRDSGNYSCMYSFTKYPPRNVTGQRNNSIHVQVTDFSRKRLSTGLR
ncbi:immunoglobulin superfamily member 1-like isoform X2, partial [Clarias magur]